MTGRVLNMEQRDQETHAQPTLVSHGTHPLICRENFRG